MEKALRVGIWVMVRISESRPPGLALSLCLASHPNLRECVFCSIKQSPINLQVCVTVKRCMAMLETNTSPPHPLKVPPARLGSDGCLVGILSAPTGVLKRCSHSCSS